MMTPRYRTFAKTFAVGFTLALAVCLTASQALADGFRNPPPGAKAQALDGGKIAFIDDATAVTHNPANLTELQAAEVLGSATVIYGFTEFSAPGVSGTTESRGKWTAIPSLYAAYPMGENGWAFGLGLSSPYGQSTEWPKDSPFKYTAPYFAEMLTLDIAPTVAKQVNDSLSVGIGLNLMYSELDLRQEIPGPAGPASDGRLRVEGDGFAVGGTVGVTYKFLERHRVAVTYKLPVNVDYEGDTTLSGPPLPNSSFDSEIDFPQMVVVGYGLQARDDLRIAADVEWIEFSRFSELPLDLGVNNAAGLAPPAIPQNWDDTWTAGVSLDWQQSENVALRAGYKYMESPIPDETHAPTLPDADRHLVTLGAGYEKGAHHLDLAYALSLFESRDVRTAPVPAFNGDYDLTSHILVATYGYQF